MSPVYIYQYFPQDDTGVADDQLEGVPIDAQALPLCSAPPVDYVYRFSDLRVIYYRRTAREVFEDADDRLEGVLMGPLGMLLCSAHLGRHTYRFSALQVVHSSRSGPKMSSKTLVTDLKVF